MEKRDFDSETEESPANLSSVEPESPKNSAQNAGISEYEKQRLSRIAENRARMEALGLTKISSPLMGSGQKVNKHKYKGKMVKDKDEDYRPDDDDDDDQEDEDFVVSGSYRSPGRKVKIKGSKPKKVVSLEKLLSNSDYIDEEDELQQAIALSLKESAEVRSGPSQSSDSHAIDGTLNERKENAYLLEDTGKRRKRKSQFTRRVQMTENELVVHFCQFDDAGKGSITLQDLRRIAVAHDFPWTDKEMGDMIYCFDCDGDGKLSIDDFQKIVGRCNMIQGSGNS